jgi:GNAT superfamily N-acetyltransferase
MEEGFDVGAAGVEEGTEDSARVGPGCVPRNQDYGVDAAEALRPGSAEELHEDGLGLVVEGVGGKDGVGLAGGDEGVEEVVAEDAGGFFDGLSGAGDPVGNADAVEVEGDVEAGAEGFDKLPVCGGFFRIADAVVDVGGAEAYAEGLAGGGVGGVEGEEEGDGVCAAGEGYADAVAWFDVGAIEGERGGWHRVHVSCCCESSYTDEMFETRLATVADAELIGAQRHRMFVDSGQADDERMQTVIAKFIPWVRAKLEDGSYVGWLSSEDGRVVAGAGMWMMDFPPHWMDAEPVRAYLLNFYVDPAFRGHGLAYALLKTAVGAARLRGIKVVLLHASRSGRPLYKRNGFEATNEMILRNRDGIR